MRPFYENSFTVDCKFGTKELFRFEYTCDVKGSPSRGPTSEINLNQ